MPVPCIAERWRQIEALFQQALEVESAVRIDFVQRAARDDEQLRHEVLSLLKAGQRDDAFLDQPIHGGVVRLISNDAGTDIDPASLVGQCMGAYRLDALIAVGGMGAVYRARRAGDGNEGVPAHSRSPEFAVKVVRKCVAGGSDTPGSSTGLSEGLQRRFRREWQVLAGLDHPNIARFIDGGAASDGRPYFVMEFIDGAPIDEYCRGRNTNGDGSPPLSPREIVSLFAPVCAAVHHAHQRLIIHRDLKPGNILVTRESVPKLLDFGVAKILDPTGFLHGSNAAHQRTVTGEFMGTFAWAAPEQIAGASAPHGRTNSFGIDIRTDVYALGLILYRLLAGRHALELRAPVAEVVRSIMEHEPTAPSRAAADRAGLDADLDAVVLRALAKDPARRYQSAGDLAADLDRWLRGEPVLARAEAPSATWYLLRKTLRRYRLPLAFAAMLLVVVTAFAVVASVQSHRLAERGGELSAALRLSKIERGRLLGQSGNLAGAEQLIWPEYIDEQRGRSEMSALERLSRWALWELYAQQPSLRAFRVDGEGISHIQVSPDESFIGLIDTGETRRGLVAWLAPAATDASSFHAAPSPDVRTGKHVEAPVHDRIIMSRGGTLFVVHHHDGRFTVHGSNESHAPLASFQTEERPDDSVTAIAPNGEFLCMLSETHLIIRRLPDGEVLLAHAVDPADRIGPRSVISGAAIVSPDNHFLYRAAKDGVLRRFDLRTGEATVICRGSSGGFHAIACSDDGRYVAVDTDRTEVSIVDLSALEVVAVIAEPGGWVSSLSFRPQEGTQPHPPLLAISTADKVIRLVEVPSGRVLKRLTGHHANATICFSRDGNRLYSAGRDGLVRIWDVRAMMQERPPACTPIPGGMKDERRPSTVFNMRHIPNLHAMAVCFGDRDPVIRLIDISTGQTLATLHGHTDAVSSIAVDPRGRYLISASYDQTIRRWDFDGLLLEAPDLPLRASRASILLQGTGMLNAIAVAPDGKRLACSTGQSSILILNAETGAVLEEHHFAVMRVPSIAWSPDGRFIAAATVEPGRVELLDVHDGSRMTMAEKAGHRIVRFSPDGRWLAAGGEDGNVRVWRLPQRRHPQVDPPMVLSGHQQDVFALDFAPNGFTLASAGRSGDVRLWDLSSGHALAIIGAHSDMIFALKFIDDGTLWSGGREGGVMAWNLACYDDHICANAAVFSPSPPPRSNRPQTPSR